MVHDEAYYSSTWSITAIFFSGFYHMNTIILVKKCFISLIISDIIVLQFVFYSWLIKINNRNFKLNFKYFYFNNLINYFFFLLYNIFIGIIIIPNIFINNFIFSISISKTFSIIIIWRTNFRTHFKKLNYYYFQQLYIYLLLYEKINFICINCFLYV